MYLIIVRVGDGNEYTWEVHMNRKKAEGDVWPESEAEEEIKKLMSNGKVVKAYKVEKVEICIKLKPETS